MCLQVNFRIETTLFSGKSTSTSTLMHLTQYGLKLQFSGYTKRAQGRAPGSEMNFNIPVQYLRLVVISSYMRVCVESIVVYLYHYLGWKQIKRCKCHPVGELRGSFWTLGWLSPVALFLSLCYRFVTILLFSLFEHHQQGTSSSTTNYY